VLNSKSYFDKTILIIGAGSIGERHIRNLWSLGYHKLYVYRQRNNPFRDIQDAEVEVLTDWEDVTRIQPFAAFITSPTSQHLTQATLCAKMGMHILVEKPLSHTLNGIDLLINVVKENGIYLQVAYMMRYHPLIVKLKNIIDLKELGNLLSFTSKWGEYLPDWHPWEDYKTSYAANKELGGGAALTLSHDIDLANWLCGSDIAQFHIIKNTRSKLEVDVEAGADIIVKYKNGISGHIHLNYYEKIPERYLKLVFDNGSVHFDYFNSALYIRKKDIQENIVLNEFDRNDMFLLQTKSFFENINSYSISDSVSQIAESETIIKICNVSN
jgi:predicted dehydrogenase